MSITSEAIDPAIASPAQKLETTLPTAAKSVDPVRLICDLAESSAFCDGGNVPHLPVAVAFGSGRLHQCSLIGSWDLDRAVSENAQTLHRSIRFLCRNEPSHRWDDLTFQFGPRSFLYADMNRIVGFASTPAEAELLVTQFNKNYAKPAPPSGGAFYLIKQSGDDISCERVPLGVDTILSHQALDLHYRSGTREWHHDFTRKLRESIHGLAILEGTPGTGKTSYLRHLIGALDKSHRFYFIPTSTMSVLSNPEFIGFWSDQRRTHSNRQFVVILEDSDTALMTRDSDNREQVSAILNLSDGMLADFLRLQIICTINCAAADIDPALMRPGRLLCHRVFGRLDYSDACRLAKYLGRTLTAARDYSLAEVFAGHEWKDTNRPHIGFAA